MCPFLDDAVNEETGSGGGGGPPVVEHMELAISGLFLGEERKGGGGGAESVRTSTSPWLHPNTNSSMPSSSTSQKVMATTVGLEDTPVVVMVAVVVGGETSGTRAPSGALTEGVHRQMRSIP